MQEWVGKRYKIFMRNLKTLSDRPIIYNGQVISFTGNFITINDRNNNKISINVNDIIQVIEE
jgi:hypothetical protein